MAVLKAVQTVYLLVASKADMMAVLMVVLMAELMVVLTAGYSAVGMVDLMAAD